MSKVYRITRWHASPSKYSGVSANWHPKQDRSRPKPLIHESRYPCPKFDSSSRTLAFQYRGITCELSSIVEKYSSTLRRPLHKNRITTTQTFHETVKVVLHSPDHVVVRVSLSSTAFVATAKSFLRRFGVKEGSRERACEAQ